MKKYSSIDEYIDAQQSEVADRLTQIRELFHKVLPDTEESIRYDMLAFTVGDEYLYVGAYKNHIGMYPLYDVPELDEELLPFHGKDTKDALHFKHSETLPLELIEQIIIAKDNKKTSS